MDEDLEIEEALLLGIAGFIDEEDNEEGDRWVVVPVDVRAFQNMGDPGFQHHFRLCRVTFEALYECIRDYMVEHNLMQRERRSLDLMIMQTLWILATPDSFRSVALQFGVHPGTVHRHYKRITSVLSALAVRYIKWPNGEERQVISEAFHRYSGIPGIVGCVDGTPIVITAPTIQPRRYIDRHHQYSIAVQCVCDHELLVRDIYVGEAGAMNDARVFRRSPLCLELLTNPQLLDEDQHIIGDSIYPLTDKLQKPYRNNGHLNEQQRLFNYRLCKSRARVEHCFGKLFSQWRRLKFMHCFEFQYAVESIVSCFMLHNFIILNGQELPEDLVHIEGAEPDAIFEEALEGEFDHFPEEFLDRHPLLRQFRDAHLRGNQKRFQIAEALFNAHIVH